MDRLAQLGALKTNEWNYLQEQMSRLVQAWKEGDPGDLEKFLPPPGDVLRAITLQELIMTDLEMRWQSGQSVSLDYYVGKYPELGAQESLPTKLIFEEYRVRTRYGDGPHLGSYRRRFPRQFSELEILIGQQPPPVPVQEPSSAMLNPFAGTGPMTNPQVELNGYKLLRRIASGAFADVYEAEALGGVRAAVKIIRQSLTNEDAKRELEALEVFKQLSHTCLVQLRGIWVHEDRLCVAMDLGDCTLRDRLQECRKEGTTDGGVQGIPPHELLGYFRDSAEALDYLHSEKVLHRDVKPANILLFKAKRRSPKSGTGSEFQARAKLADFGLARLLESQRIDASGGGTLAYMAPEACRNRTNPQSDQYSLAASYAELRLGRPLFPYTNMLELTEAHLRETPDLSPLPLGEQKALLRALAKDPQDRFPTCQQLISALDEVLGSPARPSSRTSVTLAGYRMVRLMGGTARGESWEAVSPKGSHVGLTVLRNQPWEQAAEERRTLQFLRGMDHPNLARLLDVFLLDPEENILVPDAGPPPGTAPVTVCLVNELLTESLAQRLDRHEKGIPPFELIGWMWQAAEALDTLRGPYPVDSPPRKEEKRAAGKWLFGRGKQTGSAPAADTVTLLHGAISPRSLFVDGTTLKVGDFTLAKLWHSSQGLLARDETLLPGFVAPELYGKQAHASSDQYSLAITYVELRTGRSPFQSSAPAVLRALQQEGKLQLKRLPDPEVDVIKRATSLTPADRYPTCRDMVAALEEACFASGLRVAGNRSQSGQGRKPTPAAPPVFPAAPPAMPAGPSAEDSGSFHLPSTGAAAVKTLPGTAAKALGVSETIGHAPHAAVGRDVLQETRNGPAAPETSPPKAVAVETSNAPPAATPAPVKKETRPALAPPAPSAKKQKQRLMATAFLGAAAVALVVVGTLIFKPPPDPVEKETEPENGQTQQLAKDKPVKPPMVEPVIEPVVTPVASGPTAEEIRKKAEQEANLALGAIRQANQANAAAEHLKRIPKDHDGYREAQAHWHLLQALHGIQRGTPLSDGQVANWLKDGRLTAETHVRLEAILSRILELAELDAGFATGATTDLGDRSQFPQDLRGYVDFVQALGDEHAKRLGEAAEKLMEVIVAERPKPRVLTTPKRKQGVATTLTSAAEQSHSRDSIRQPFQGGNTGTEKAHEWLTAANALLEGTIDPQAPSRAYLLAIATWHRKGKTIAETEVVRKTTQNLIARRTELASKLAFGLSFLVVYAECQDESRLEGAAAAVNSYKEAVARFKAEDLSAQTSAKELFDYVFVPALKLLDSTALNRADTETKKVMAALSVEYARFLRKHEAADRLHGLRPIQVHQQVLANLGRAVDLDRTPEHVLEYVRVNLEDNGPVSPQVQKHAEWLVDQPPESTVAYHVLVRVLQRTAEYEQEARQIRALRLLRDAIRRGLELVKQPGGAQNEERALTEAKTSYEKLVRKATERGYELGKNFESYEAVEWALSFRKLDLHAASRVAGDSYWRLGELALAAGDSNGQMRNLLLAREKYEAGVENGEAPAPIWDMALRASHLEVLNTIKGSAEADKPTAVELRTYAEALAVSAEKLDENQRGLHYGWAYGTAGMAWAFIANDSKNADKQTMKKICLEVTTCLEKACNYYASDGRNVAWRVTYGDFAQVLIELAPDKESAAICNKAIKRLKEALDPKAPYHARLKTLNKVAEVTDLIKTLDKLVSGLPK